MLTTNLIKIFLFKVFTEKWRHPFRNLLNTLFPIVVIGVYVFSRSGYQRGGAGKSSQDGPVVLSEALSQDDLVQFFPTGFYNKLFYAPKDEFTEQLIEQVRQKLFITIDRVESFPTAADMELTILVSQDFYAIDFGRNSSEAHLSYTIRSKNNNFRTGEIYSRNLYSSYLKDRNEYFESGFLALQYAIEKSFVEIRTGLADESLPEFSYEHIPLGGPRPQESSEIFTVNVMLAVFVSVACTYLLLVPLVEEKASGMKEYLKIATPFSYWNEVAIFMVNFIHLGTIALACMILTNVAAIWEATAAQTVFAYLLLFLFLICTITFTFFISTLLESVTISTIIAPICYFAPVIFASAQVKFELYMMIFPMNGFKAGVSILHDYQNSWHSFRAFDAFVTGYPGKGQFSLFVVILMLMFGSVLWAFLWFYISNVRPGRYGTPKRWNFCMKMEYYQRGKNKIKHKQIHDHSSLTEEDITGNSGVMEDGDHLEKVVKISKLNKVFKTSTGTRMAVKDLSIKIYKNRITALLGHNGAGKTTTMNIITGMTPRTSGRIEIDGEDNSTNYRQQIGFCPQHNVALGYMTCREHLIFFGVLRGMSKEEAKIKAEEILEKVNLKNKSDQVLSKLSGGMKRRLCLANAIIGMTKLLILDEPTSGLDPESRRDVWDILLKLKKDHTILITTHFMEEADVLGDWIAIMENGELIAFGTSIFLKHHYGKGYTLKLLKDDFFKRDKVMEKIHEFISGAAERPTVEPVFAVTLPFICIDQYAGLFKDLEDNKDEYGINSISVSNATLEEVFLNSSSNNKALEQGESIDLVDGPTGSPSTTNSAQSKQNENICQKLQLSFIHQFQAILNKKIIHAKRNLHIYAFMSLLPIITTPICFLLSNGYSKTDYDSISLQHSMVDRAFAVIVLNNNDRSIDFSSLKNGSYFRDLDTIVLEDQNIEDYLHQEAKKDWIRYYDRLVAAVEYNVSDRTMKMLHNNNLLHSAGIAANIGSNLLLHYYGYPQADVTVQNSPSTRKLQVDSMTPYLYTEGIALVFMLYILQYMQLPYMEASTGFKQLQNINRYVYWGSTFLIDIVVHLTICLVVVLLALSMDRENLFSRTEHWQIFSILFLYGWVGLLVIYIISQCVDLMDTALTFMSYLMIVGVCGVFLLSDGYDRIRENDGWIMWLHLIPEFALKHSLRVVYENQKLSKIQALIAENSVDDNGKAVQKLNLVYVYVFVPFMVTFFTLLLNEVIENIDRKGSIMEAKARMITLLQKRRAKQQKGIDQVDSNLQMNTNDVIDDDVDAESKLVDNLVTKEPLELNPYVIAVHSLKKHYFDLPAVKGISFTVKRGECFGLLGMNGAGKTSTFQMITRNLPITDGTIYLNDRNVKQTNESEYRSQFGYCPQGDSLLDFMTPHEVINYSANVKNLPDRENLINRWLTDLDILEFAHSRIGECSGGTKRKVNTILAMLGNPSIVFLDEPTTGVDPKSKHFVWSRIKELQRRDQTIILTSHSMDECEELCNRLSIMVDGQLRCIGFIQRLKEKYGKGFNLLLKLKRGVDGLSNEQINEIQDNLQIEKCKRRYEEHDGMLKFLVPETIQLSELFSQASAFQATNAEQISTFSIDETSLEDVFLSFRPNSDFVRNLIYLLFVRATLSNQNFKLAINMKQAGQFDDVVMYNSEADEWWLITAKPKENKNSVITKEVLFPTNEKSQKRGDFSMFKYFQSFMCVRQYWPYGGKIKLHLVTNVAIDEAIVCETAKVHNILEVSCARHVRLANNAKLHANLKEFVNRKFFALRDAIVKLFKGGKIDKILDDYMMGEIFDNLDGCIKFSPSFSENHTNVSLRKLYTELHALGITKRTVPVTKNTSRLWCAKSRMDNWPLKAEDNDVAAFFDSLVISIYQPKANNMTKIIQRDLQLWLSTWLRSVEYVNVYQNQVFNEIKDYLEQWDRKGQTRSFLTLDLAEQCLETVRKKILTMLRRFGTYEAGDLGGHGHDYQRNLALLLFERATIRKTEFRMACKMSDAGIFNDVVMHNIGNDEWWLIQVKLKEKANMNLTKQDLFHSDVRSQKKSDFYLFKYFESYIRVNDYWMHGGKTCFHIFSNVGIDRTIKCTEIKDDNFLSFPGAKRFQLIPDEDTIKNMQQRINVDFITLRDAIVQMFTGSDTIDNILFDYKSLLVKILEKNGSEIKFAPSFRGGHRDVRVGKLYDELDRLGIIDKIVSVTKSTAKLWKGRSRIDYWPPVVDTIRVNRFFQDLTLCVSQPSSDALVGIIQKDLQRWMQDWIPQAEFDSLHQYLLSMPFNEMRKYLKQWEMIRKERPFQTLEMARQCFKTVQDNMLKLIKGMPVAEFREEIDNHCVQYVRQNDNLALSDGVRNTTDLSRDRTVLAASMDRNSYETYKSGGSGSRDIMLLLFERAALRKEHFKLALNMEATGKFKIFFFSEKIRELFFFQVKYFHKSKEQKLTQEMLFPTDEKSKKKGECSLYPYLEFYLLQRDRWEYAGSRKIYLFTNIKIDLRMPFKETRVNEILELSTGQHIQLTPSKCVVDEMKKYINQEFNALRQSIIQLFTGFGINSKLIKYKSLVVEILDKSKGTIRFSDRFSASHTEVCVRELYKSLHALHITEKSVSLEQADIDKLWNGASRHSRWPMIVDNAGVQQFFNDLILSVSQPSAKEIAELVNNDLQIWLKTLYPEAYQKLNQSELSLPFNEIKNYLMKWERMTEFRIFQTLALAEQCFKTIEEKVKNSMETIPRVDLTDSSSPMLNMERNLQRTVSNGTVDFEGTYMTRDSGEHGYDFKRNVTYLLCARSAILAKHKFMLEIKKDIQFGKLDFFVMNDKKSNTCWFVQTKHRMNVNIELKREMLFPKNNSKNKNCKNNNYNNSNKSQKHGEFSLYKYLEFYIFLRDYWKSAETKKLHLFTNIRISKEVGFVKTEVDTILNFADALHVQLTKNDADLKQLNEYINRDFIELLNAIARFFNCGEIDEKLQSYKTLLDTILSKSAGFIEFSPKFSANHEDARVCQLYSALHNLGITNLRVPVTDATDKLWTNHVAQVYHWPPKVDSKTVDQFFNDLILSVSLPRADKLAAIFEHELQLWMKNWISPDAYSKLHQYLLSVPLHEIKRNINIWERIEKHRPSARVEKWLKTVKHNMQNLIAIYNYGGINKEDSLKTTHVATPDRV